MKWMNSYTSITKINYMMFNNFTKKMFKNQSLPKKNTNLKLEVDNK